MPEKHIQFYLETIEHMLENEYPKLYDKIIKTLLNNVEIALYGASGYGYGPMNVLIEINVNLLLDILRVLEIEEGVQVLMELAEENKQKEKNSKRFLLKIKD